MGMTIRFALRQLTRESNVTPGPLPEEWIEQHDGPLRPGHAARDPAPVPQLAARDGWPRPAAGSASCACPRSSCGARATPTSRRASARDYAAALPDGRAARVPGRRALGLARPARHDRPRRGLPERRVSAAPHSRARGSAGALALLRRPPAWTLTALLALAYLIARAAEPGPRGGELPQPSLRRSVGFTIWDNSWYGGHHLPAYSVLAPALGAAIGPALLAALSMTAAAALFEIAVGGRFPRPRGPRRRALVRLRRRHRAALEPRALRPRPRDRARRRSCSRSAARWAAALALAALTALASPVAGAFLALAAVAWALGVRGTPARALAARRSPSRALAPVALLTIAFPEGGTQPFVASAFYPALAAVARDRRSRCRPSSACCASAPLLYALALIGAYVVPSAVGGNVDRLGALAAGPLAACALLDAAPRWRHWAVLVARRPADLLAGERAAHRLRLDAVEPRRGASPTTSRCSPSCARSASATGAGPSASRSCRRSITGRRATSRRRVMLARGWERQLDRYRNSLFYERGRARTRSPITNGWRSRRSPTSRCPTPRWTTRARARRASCARPSSTAAAGSCAKSGARATGACSPSPGRSRSPSPQRCVSAASTRLVHAARARSAGTYWVRMRFTPYWSLSSGTRMRRRRRTRLDRRARRSGPARFHVGDRLLARARLRPRRPVPVSIV